MLQRPSVRSLLFAGASVSLGAVAALLVVEIGLRVLSVAPSAGISTVSEAEFARVPGLFSPGQRIVVRQVRALPFAVQIDSLGYRGSDFPKGKTSGELRILMVGDSFTFGDFVDDDETLPAQVERQLSARCARPAIVINAGVGGSTITTAIQMVKRAWVTRPDIVVLTFSENDVADLRSDNWHELAENRKAKSRFPLSVAYPVLRNLALWHFALDLRARWRVQARRSTGPDLFSNGPKGAVQALRAEYGRRFRDLAVEVRSKGRPLVLVAWPSHMTTRGAIGDDQLRWVEEIAKEESVPTINLLRPFRASGLPVDSLYLLPRDGHASPRGNELAGAQVAANLVEGGFCDGQKRIE